MIIWLGTVALAGSVFINGVNVDGLRNQQFDDVNVVIDADGNVRIDAPGYQIEVVGQATTRPPPPPPPDPVVTAPPVSGVAVGRWWLITEDNGSYGHVAQIFVNGQLVRTVRSGEPQAIFDVGPYLRSGNNEVRLASDSSGASGGTFYVYMGSGSNDSGTVVMDPPQVQFGLGPSREGHYERTYTLQVP